MNSTYIEPARTVPVVEETDVLVAGGGPAGALAALAAARCGARVRLIEAHGALGGIWTTGCLPHVIEHDKGGLVCELFTRLAAAEGCSHQTPLDGPGSRMDYDVERVKHVLETLCGEAGVALRYYTRVAAAHVNAAGRLETVITDSKSGREAWRAKVFIDCTGDGDLGAQAGCSWELGQPGTGLCQPMSMMAILTGAGRADEPPFTLREWGPNKAWIKAEMERGGHTPSYAHPTMFLVRDGYIIMMANHEYGYRQPDAQKLTDATIHGRTENLAIAAALRRADARWANVQVVAQSSQIGVRESRRIHGLYRVTTDDLVRGARFDDAVCRVSFCVDVHALDPAKGKGIDDTGVRARPYDIPLRALIARDVTGLMMAGRCISGDFLAHSSYRVSGDAAALGEAAGVTAALAATRGVLPQEVPYDDIKPYLAAPEP